MQLKAMSKDIIKNKRVVLRIDTDIEIEKEEIVDDFRLKASLETINLILSGNGKTVLIGHIGRPKKKFQISFCKTKFAYANNFKFQINKSFSLKPVAKWFEKEFHGNIEEIKINNFKGWKINENLFLLENIRFYKGEEENSDEFSKQLSELGDIFVNDAFAVSHRKEASIYGITKYLPSFAGLHLEKEIINLTKVLNNPQRPLVVLIGGAKIETKLPLVEKMHQIADYVLVGGEIAEQDRILIKVQHEKSQKKSILFVADNKRNKKDITEKSVENFIQIINLAKTIIWNGTMGLIRSNIKDQISKITENDSEYGTQEIARAIAKCEAFKVVGGGDTVAFLRKLNLLDKFDFVSTGGGAMLEFLSGEKLPGLKPLLK